MAKPGNPLDAFVSYIYHFELHGSYSWTEIKKLDESDANDVTDRFSPNGTLLINTRRDAHQIIDEVKFTAMSCLGSSSGIAVGSSAIEMIITEPGGFAFVEKIEHLKEQQEVSLAQNLIFALKVIFVGRDEDNGITTLYSKLIPMNLIGMHGSFDHRGGVYNMKFGLAANMGATNGVASGPQMRYSFTDKNVSFEAKSVKEALLRLQDRLNGNYEETYCNKLDAGKARKIVYKINWDPEICGKVNSTIKNSFAPDDANIFSFDPKKEIGAFIRDILHRSCYVNEKIGESQGMFDKQLHPNVWMPVIQANVCPREDVVEVIYDVKLYKGGGDKYEFDYFFTDPGRNVDVMNFEVVFPNMEAYIANNSNSGYDKNINASALAPTKATKTYQLDMVHEDKTKHRLESLEPERRALNLLPKDIAPPLAKTQADRNGHNITPLTEVKQSRLAFSTATEMGSAGAYPQQTFTIRGHLDILNACCGYPEQGSENEQFGTTQGLWVKVNIYMPVGDTGERLQFFYTGWYEVVTVTNIFSGGKFIQQLMVCAKEQSA
jgi:hypothetical protein